MPELGHPLADTLEHSGYSECPGLPARLTLIKDVGDLVCLSSNWAFFQQKIGQTDWNSWAKARQNHRE